MHTHTLDLVRTFSCNLSSLAVNSKVQWTEVYPKGQGSRTLVLPSSCGVSSTSGCVRFSIIDDGERRAHESDLIGLNLLGQSPVI